MWIKIAKNHRFFGKLGFEKSKSEGGEVVLKNYVG